MCFSATASFTAGTAPSAVGGLTLRKSQGKVELPLALVPLLFGVQQFAEGFLWLSLRNELPTVRTSATYIFSMFSHVWLPIFVPLSILLVEHDRPIRASISVFQTLVLGL